MYVSGMIEWHVDDGGFQAVDAGTPHAARLVRDQARRAQPVTSGQHVSVT
jgi:hypothetical protein